MSTVEHRPEQRQFILDTEEGRGELEYQQTKDGNLVIAHTEVPQKAEGKGYGSALVKAALEYAKENDLKVMPLCPYAASYIKRHRQEYGDMLTAGFNV